MLREDNVAHAERNLAEIIYDEIRLENIGATRSQVKELIENGYSDGLDTDETYAIINLKHAWGHTLNTLNMPLNLSWLRRMNEIIGAGGIVRYAGELRRKIITVEEIGWIPPFPTEPGIMTMCEKLDSIEDPTERALHAFCDIARAHMFNGGNKRTAQLAANKILIGHGCGVLIVKENDKPEFTEKLMAFYKSNDDAELCRFLEDRCIDTFELAPKKKMQQMTQNLESQAKEILESADRTDEPECSI